MAKTVCIYHGNCADGFTAAWVVRKWWNKQIDREHSLSPIQHDSEIYVRDIEFIAGVYQTPVPLDKLARADVIIVDFSYKLPVMEQIASVAKSVTWIDHHKSAMEDMWAWRDPNKPPSNVRTLTDLNRSGAGLTWDYFFPNQPRPKLVSIVEDRDLWKFKYPDTREIQAYIFSFEYTWENWDRIRAELADDPVKVTAAGAAIERKHFKDINELLPICTRRINIGGISVDCANLPYTMVSDAGNILATRNPKLFGACYYDGELGRNFSLRSVEGGLDVSEIAVQYGGGGHARAAGFRISFEKAKEFEIEQS